MGRAEVAGCGVGGAVGEEAFLLEKVVGGRRRRRSDTGEEGGGVVSEISIRVMKIAVAPKSWGRLDRSSDWVGFQRGALAKLPDLVDFNPHLIAAVDWSGACVARALREQD